MWGPTAFANVCVLFTGGSREEEHEIAFGGISKFDNILSQHPATLVCLLACLFSGGVKGLGAVGPTRCQVHLEVSLQGQRPHAALFSSTSPFGTQMVTAPIALRIHKRLWHLTAETRPVLPTVGGQC